jgi:hypothetical protein
MFLYGWLQIAVEALISGDFNPGQVLVLIGRRIAERVSCRIKLLRHYLAAGKRNRIST